MGGVRLGKDGRGRLDGLVADDRAEPRIIVVLALIRLEERIVLRRLDAVPGIAGDDPSLRRFFLQWIEILRLAGEERDHFAILEKTARIAFAHELYKVRAEGDGEA